VPSPSFPDAHTGRTRLILLLGVALALRLAWALAQPVTDESIDRLPDQAEYLALGRNLLHGQGLKFFDPRFGDEVWAYRTPGYPFLIAACNGNVRVIRVVQAFIDTSTVLAVYLLARRWLGRGASMAAGVIVALNPFLIYFTGLILTETLFTAMLAWGMLLVLWRARGDEPVGWGATLAWLSGGLILALAVLVRQSAIGLPLLLGVGGALVNRGGGTPYHRRWPLPVGATAILLTLLVLLPWAWRNDRVLGRWVWTTTNGGITAYDGLNPDATGASDQSFVRAMPELRSMDELARSAYLSDLARQFARQQPRRVAELAVIKAARTWSPVPLSQEYNGWKYRTVGLLYTVPLYGLVLLGLVRRDAGGGGLSRAAKVYLLIPAIYFTAVHMLSVGSLRYRIPAEPPMAVLAASVAALPAAGWKRSGRGFEVVPEVGTKDDPPESE
jgi:4-amino-4-deoxy-L-arabinose transferase-like glycosyltransferase